MSIVKPNFERRIDLPGAGPCARPVDIDRALTGFTKLVSLRVYTFVEGVVIDGEAEADEVFIVLMRGSADVTVSSGGRQAGSFSLRQGGGTRAVYMPPQASYRLTAGAECDIAYARGAPGDTKLSDTCGFVSAAGRLDIVGHALSMDLVIAAVKAGENGSLNEDGGSPERLMHVRSNGMTAAIAGQSIGDWDSILIADGQSARLEVETGMAEILIVSASGPELRFQ